LLEENTSTYLHNFKFYNGFLNFTLQAWATKEKNRYITLHCDLKFCESRHIKPGVVAHACNPSYSGAREAGKLRV
jgi:hypothetical protein